MFDFLKKAKFKIVSPAKGKMKDITEVDDEAFSSKSLGDGFAIEPKNGEVYSAMDGVVEMIFPTLHAFGLKNSNLNGEGFELLVREGQKIKAGDILVKFDIESIKSKVASTDRIVVFTSGESCELIKNWVNVESSEEEIVNIK